MLSPRISLIIPLSLAVENVGETIARAFFHCSSFNCVRPCESGPKSILID